MTALVVTPHAQSSDPSAQPKLTFNDLYYVGAFRLPSASSNGDSFEFGGQAIAFNPADNSLFVTSRGSRVAQVSIPTPVNTANPSAMPFASYLQPFADPTEGHLGEVGTDGVSVASLMVFGNRLVGTASVYYDANNTQTLSHFSHGLQLNQPTFSGWSRVWNDKKTGFVSGAMSLVPTEWRGILGGPAATGQCCIPIVMRTSVGPAAFSFDPAQVGQPTVAANPLLYYDLDHPTLGIWDNSSPVYGSTTQMGGMAMIAGTRTVLYIGRNGMASSVCYGDGTADQTLVGTMASDGAHYCYDPTDSSKGQHAYPYRYQIWAYDMNDLAAVKSGAKQPWEVTPYGVWPFDFPTHDDAMKIGGVTYDATRQLLYVSQMLVDKDGYAYRPLIHVLHVNATPGTVDPNDTTSLSQATTYVPPASSSTSSSTSSSSTSTTSSTSSTSSTGSTSTTSSSVVSAITLSVNKPSPQLVGSAITFSAYAIGGVMPQEYKWLVNDGTGFKPVTAWSTVETFTWTPSVANAKYRVRVWARSHGNTEDDPEAIATATFAINASAPAPTYPVRAVAISWDKPAPLPAGTSVTFTATPDGGSNLEYKWLIHDGLQWNIVSGWSSQNTFAWTAGAANSSNRVGVWVRTAGNTQEGGEVTRSEDYPISAAVVSEVPVTTTPAPVVTTTPPVAPTTTTTTTTATPSIMTVSTTTVAPGAQMSVVIANTGAADPWDYVMVAPAGAAANYFSGVFQFLNGTTTLPASAIRNATLTVRAPTTPGSYELRFNAAGQFNRLATVTITVGTTASTTTASTTTTTSTTTSTTSTASAAMTVNGSTSAMTVAAGATLPVVLTNNGAADPWDYVMVAPVGSATNYFSGVFQFMNGTTTLPATAIRSATINVRMPAAPGTYELRYNAAGQFNRLATSAIITVTP